MEDVGQGQAVQQMSKADFDLSMRISPRARRPEDNEGLRDLRVHRLSDTTKAVARVGLRNGRISIYCEACGTWTPVEEFPVEYDCACGRSYRTEFVIFEEVE